MDWQARVEDLLYDGESVRESVLAGSGRIVVTTHRVLAFTPDDRETRFRQVDRPNVTGVGLAYRTQRNLRSYGLRLAVPGVALSLVGLLVDFEGATTDAMSGLPESGGIDVFQATEILFVLFARLNETLLQVGGLLLLLAVIVGGLYWYRREQRLVIEIAGSTPDISLPRPADGQAAVGRLDRALFEDESV
jgi:hypothetical protein